MGLTGFLLLALLATVSVVDSARILAVFAFPGKSHFMMTKPLIRELTKRGHEVTFITSFPIGEKLDNFTEIVITPVYDFWADVRAEFGADNIFEFTDMTQLGFLRMLDIIGTTTTEHALKQPAIQEIFNSTETNRYDLLIVEQFYQEAFLALSYKYNIPAISMSTLGNVNYMSQIMGVITPWSFVPHGFSPFLDKMTLFERMTNTFFSLLEDFHREFVYFPKQDALVKKYLSHLPVEIPPVTKMEKNLSAMLLNSFYPLTTSRPTVPGMIYVGGMHLKPKPSPLPKDIKEFLDNAKDGAIYFSLGSNVQSADMPPEMMKMFISVLGKLKLKTLWKFENETIQMPPNVMIKKWMPQGDILAHPNIKLFITHGGLFGTQEGVQNAVPMLGIPVYCDQHLNMNKAAKAGYAISLKFQDITADKLESTINELLTNPSYKENVQRISDIFLDRPMSAMDTAMYWVNYVIRHKGAPHLRSAGLDLAWYEYYLLDVIAIYLLGVGIVLGTLLAIAKRLFQVKSVKVKTN